MDDPAAPPRAFQRPPSPRRAYLGRPPRQLEHVLRRFGFTEPQIHAFRLAFEQRAALLFEEENDSSEIRRKPSVVERIYDAFHANRHAGPRIAEDVVMDIAPSDASHAVRNLLLIVARETARRVASDARDNLIRDFLGGTRDRAG